jgi:hypothetical protein
MLNSVGVKNQGVTRYWKGLPLQFDRSIQTYDLIRRIADLLTRAVTSCHILVQRLLQVKLAIIEKREIKKPGRAAVKLDRRLRRGDAFDLVRVLRPTVLPARPDFHPSLNLTVCSSWMRPSRRTAAVSMIPFNRVPAG